MNCECLGCISHNPPGRAVGLTLYYQSNGELSLFDIMPSCKECMDLITDESKRTKLLFPKEQ